MTDTKVNGDTQDKGYRDSLTKIEPYGVDHIPEVERHGNPASQFFIWFAAGMNFPIVVLGFSATYFGLSMWQAISAILVGTIVGSCLMGLLTRMGVRLGIPQQMQARGPLGFVGNLPPVAYVNVFAGIGWAALTIILGGKALAQLTTLPFPLVAFGLTLVQLVVSVIGYNLIHLVQRILTVVLFLGFLWITVISLMRGAMVLDANPQASGYIGGIGGWITFAGYFLAFLVAWLPFASDYSRYLPDSASNRRSASIAATLGNFITLSWMGIVGVVLASTATSHDPISALHQLMGPWAVPGLLTIAVSAFAQNFLNIYGGAISIQTMGLPVKRTTGVIAMCIASYFVALWAHAGVYTAFSAFLNLTSYFIAPYITVLICDYYFGGRQTQKGLAEVFDTSRKFEWGFVAWLAGVIGSSPLWISPLYTGPLARAYPQMGDLSMYVGVLLAAVVYFALLPLPSLARSKHQATGTSASGA